MRKPRYAGFVFSVQRPLGRLLVRDQLEAVRAFLVVGEHHGDAIGKGLVFQSDGKSSTAPVGPGRTYARPYFLAALVFAGLLAVVDNIGRCVGHMLISVALRGGVSMALSPHERTLFHEEG